MQWVMHKTLTSDAYAHPAESNLGMDREAFMGLFVNAHLQSAKPIAEAMRKYLATGEIPDKRRQREVWNGRFVHIEAERPVEPAPAERRTISDLIRDLLTPARVSVNPTATEVRLTDDMVCPEGVRQRALAPAD
jgi:hypothetical protein